MPTLMLATAQPLSTGITAQAVTARPKVIIGARVNSSRSAPVGKIVSLKTIFSASAKGCHRPNGPTTLGPLRSWIAPITLRSK